MAAMKLLLSQARRHCLAKSHSSPFLNLRKCLSSSIPDTPDRSPPRNPEPSRSQVSVQPVSYAVKPKEESDAPPANENQESQQLKQQEERQPQPSRPPRETLSPEARTSLTREDIRYVKDVPSISPVSYPARVAPLPEDKVAAEGQTAQESEETEKESKKVESESRFARRRSFRLMEEEERVVVSFPTLIKVDNKGKEKRPIIDLTDAIKQVKANAKANFDETVEAHVRLAIPPRKTELIVRGTMNLPHGDKKAVRVAYFAEGADADEARAVGADIVGGLELIEEIASSGKIDVDKCFATRQLMTRLFKISKILNHQGLMPNPKQGTVTNDVTRAVKEAKQGHVKFKMDNTSNVHVGLGKVSLKDELLRDNVGAFVSALLLAKPAGLKKTSKFAGYVNAFHLCSSMGPGFPVSIQSLSRALDQYNKSQLQ